MRIRYRLAEVNTQSAQTVCELVSGLFQEVFPDADLKFIPPLFESVVDMFAGRYHGYQPMDTYYHDLEHTLQATLCFVRLIVNRSHTNAEPVLTEKDFSMGLIAMLLHDMGYLKETNDHEGTGAKFTHVHEMRSCAHAHKYLSNLDWPEKDILTVENLIRCTGPRSNICNIDFANSTERMLGQAVCTADFIGQMSDPAYVEKLPGLYKEFLESYEYQKLSEEERDFKSYGELLKMTPTFWREFVHGKLSDECANIWQFLKDPETDENPYIDSVEKNIIAIEKLIQNNASA